MPYVAVDDLTLHDEAHGVPDGPALVLLHGFRSTGAFWSNQLEAPGARYRLIVPDRRGHGRTANSAGRSVMTHRRFARDVIRLCRALGPERVTFGGESFRPRPGTVRFAGRALTARGAG